MFWGYSPAVDLLHEYFASRGEAVVEEGDDAPSSPERPPEGSGGRRRTVVVTEITEIRDGVAPDLAEAAASDVQEDDAADDSRRRVVGLLLPQDGDGRGEPQEQEVVQAGQDGGGADAQLQRDGLPGPERPLQVQDADDGGGHVHHDGAVDVQPAGHGDHPEHPVEPAGLLSPPAPHHPGDADCAEEVSAGPSPKSSARRAALPGPPGLFDIAPPPSAGEAAAGGPAGDPGGPPGQNGCLHVLLLGGLDARHVLKTLGCLHRHAAPRVRFYVAEAVMEVVARQLLFLLAALEPPDRLGAAEKAWLLMELLGNSLVRPGTARWLRHAARLLVDLVTDDKLLARRLPVVDLSHLRHQDRDRLEDILAFYQERPQGFRIGFHWDQRLRKHLQTRYDSRAGAFDWDYYMAMKDLPGGDKVCVHEYRHWRETGVAFTWLEGEQCEPNLTLGAGIFREGQRLLHGGYLGDIVTSPYIAYGVQLDEDDSAELFRKANGHYACRSTDATERHLSRILHELQHREAFVPPKDADNRTGILLSQVTDSSRLDPEAPVDEEDHTLRRVRRDADMMCYDALPVQGAEVVFLSPKFLRPEGRHAHLGKFNVVFLGRGLAEKHLNADLVRLLAPGALVLVEGTRFLLERQEARVKYAAMVREQAQAASLTSLGKFDPVEHDFAKFKLSAK